MKEKIKRWWDSAVRAVEMMDYSPVSSLSIEVTRLRREVAMLRDQIDTGTQNDARG